MVVKSHLRKAILGSFCAITLSVSGLAMGAPALALSVNFTDGTWNGAQGQTSFTSHSSGIDLYAYNGKISVNYIGGPSGDNSGYDGLGINDDEIGSGGYERLSIYFAAPVTLNQVYITDLFKDEGPSGESEVGQYSLNGVSSFTSFSSVGGANGALALNIGQSNVSYITFRSDYDRWSDFSVKGLSYSVPEPSSLLLLGISFLLFSMFYRARRSHQA